MILWKFHNRWARSTYNQLNILVILWGIIANVFLPFDFDGRLVQILNVIHYMQIK